MKKIEAVTDLCAQNLLVGPESDQPRPPNKRHTSSMSCIKKSATIRKEKKVVTTLRFCLIMYLVSKQKKRKEKKRKKNNEIRHVRCKEVNWGEVRCGTEWGMVK